MSKIKLLVMDIDGTLTDGKIYISANGELFKAFDIKDGCGIHDLLPQAKIVPVIITARKSAIVENRCRELEINYCYQGCRDKAAKLEEVAKLFHLMPNEDGVFLEIAYMGDDIIDVPCMRLCGVVGCPANAATEVKELSQFVSVREGGSGAVREFIEWIIHLNDSAPIEAAYH